MSVCHFAVVKKICLKLSGLKLNGYWILTGQVQVEGSPVKVQLLDTAGQVRQFVCLFVCFPQDIM